MDDPGDVTENRQENVEPELRTEPDGEKHANGRKQNSQNNAKEIAHDRPKGSCQAHWHAKNAEVSRSVPLKLEQSVAAGLRKTD